MKKLYVLFILSYLCCMHTSMANPIITAFFQPYPESTDLFTQLHHPGRIAEHHILSLAHPNAVKLVSGIFTSYGGYINVTDENGQVSFERKHEKPLLYIIVTTNIVPIVMMGKTIHHWELDKQTATALFKAECKQDPESELFYWDVQPEPYPKNHIIPLESLVIFAKPYKIYVPMGATPTENAINLYLPDIYVKKEVDTVANALYVLTLSQFFGPLHMLYKKEAKGYAALIEN